jgi:hypothetical protein
LVHPASGLEENYVKPQFTMNSVMQSDAQTASCMVTPQLYVEKQSLPVRSAHKTILHSLILAKSHLVNAVLRVRAHLLCIEHANNHPSFTSTRKRVNSCQIRPYSSSPPPPPDTIGSSMEDVPPPQINT